MKHLAIELIKGKYKGPYFFPGDVDETKFLYFNRHFIWIENSFSIIYNERTVDREIITYKIITDEK